MATKVTSRYAGEKEPYRYRTWCMQTILESDQSCRVSITQRKSAHGQTGSKC